MPIEKSTPSKIATSGTGELPFKPQFSFTKSIIDQLAQRGITEKDYKPFVKHLDSYLEKAAETKSLIALGIIAIPSNEGAANQFVKDGGRIINSVAYYNLSLAQCTFGNDKTDKEVDRMDEDWPNFRPMDEDSKPIVLAILQTSVSKEEYSTLEEFKATLNDDKIRSKEYTVTADHSEFWGMVTREELLREMAQNQPPTS